MSMNVNSSELGAKLLATENITVMRARVSTASFDIKNRVLTLPQWKEMSPVIEGMLIGHEVGHALYTTDEYIDPIRQDATMKSYLNVLEDVRIEKLIKRKYPGLRKTMNLGYKELNDKDFFGTAKIQNFDTLNLIDRINLYFKVGYQCGVKFTMDEKQFVNRAEKTETIEDVIALAREVFDFSAAQAEERKKQKMVSMTAEDLEELENELADDEELDESFFGNSSEDADGDTDEECNNECMASRKGTTEGDVTTAQTEREVQEELKVTTEQSFQEKLEQLADDTTEYVYYNLDERHIIDVIVPFKTVIKELAEVEEYFIKQSDIDQINKFKIESNRAVNYLIKEFEMKKSAKLYKRSTTSKIGSLDMRKVWSYQLNDDLFKRTTSLPKGKSHGMIMLVDWSASMNQVLDDTIKQVINLAMFCQRAQIPYQVFAFTTEYDLFKGEFDYGKLHQLRQEFMSTPNMLGNAVNTHFALLELFSSKMTNVEFNTMIRRIFNTRYLNYIRGYSTGGTPLNEALSYMLGYVPKFMKANNVEKMSFITLTDGAGGSLITSTGRYIEERRFDYGTYNYKCIRLKNFIKDPVTKKDYPVTRDGNTQTEAILRILKDRYNVNSVGFYICRNSRLDLRQAIENNLPGFQHIAERMVDDLRKEFKEEGFASIKNTGRDDLFIIPQNKLQLEEGEIVVEEKQTARQIARMFTKQMGGRTTSRVLLNRFIHYIA